MVKEYIVRMMVEDIKGIGLKIKWMEWDNIFGLMVESYIFFNKDILVNIKKTKKMDWENLFGLIIKNTEFILYI